MMILPSIELLDTEKDVAEQEIENEGLSPPSEILVQ